MEKLAGAEVTFPQAMNISFRARKPISKKLKLGTHVAKELKEGVTSLTLPSEFVLLKVKDLTVSA